MSSYIDDHLLLIIIEAIMPLLLMLIVLLYLLIRHFKLARAGLFYNKKKPRVVKFKQLFLLVWFTITFYQSVALFFPMLETSHEHFELYFE